MTLEASPLNSGGVLVPSAPQAHGPTGGTTIHHHNNNNVSGFAPKGMLSCAGCGKRILDKFLLKAMDMFWHEDCLKCGCCDCRLGEVGSSLYSKANLILCKRDYLRLFGTTGFCAACHKMIPAFEMVMRARTNVYHLECFACQQCNHRFCVGDRFYLMENRILCEYDYEERKVFANLPPHGSGPSSSTLNNLKRQVNAIPALPDNASGEPCARNGPTPGGGGGGGGGGGLDSGAAAHNQGDDASSGYGSPDSITMESR